VKQLPGIAEQCPGVKFVKVNVVENKESASFTLSLQKALGPVEQFGHWERVQV
jgi:hypothetical protein